MTNLRSSSILATAAVLGLSIAALGCGSSTSSSSSGSSSSSAGSSMSPTELIEAAAKATKSAKSVKINANANGTTFELVSERGTGLKGKLNEKGKEAEFIVVGGDFYLKGDESLFASAGGAASLLKGKWLKIPAGSASVGGLSQITALPDQVTTAIEKLKEKEAKLTKSGEKTVNGKPAIGLTGTEKGQKGTIYIESAEPHYPVSLESDTSGGPSTATFSGWNEPVEIKAPAESVDFSKLLG